jgi:predicted GNAT family N-acyltransferase
MSTLTSPLHAAHKKDNFDCGILLLNQYLHTQAKQDVKRKLSACFILADTNNIVKGYYTLSSTSIKREILPEQIIKKLPPTYYNLPATLLGRLAVDNKFKGQKIGALLLIDALKKCYESSLTSIGSMCVIVDPIDDNAIQFYKKFGFVLLPDSGKMFIPMLTIGELFK